MKRFLIAVPIYLAIAIYCGAIEIDPKTIYDKLDPKIYQDRNPDTGASQILEFRSSETYVATSAIHQAIVASSNTTDSISTNISLDDDVAFKTQKLSLRSIASSNRTSNTITNNPKSAE